MQRAAPAAQTKLIPSRIMGRVVQRLDHGNTNRAFSFMGTRDGFARMADPERRRGLRQPRDSKGGASTGWRPVQGLAPGPRANRLDDPRRQRLEFSNEVGRGDARTGLPTSVLRSGAL
jgi:hypothetical protein